jgi:putative spermidine/putrescine transport system permease protein
MSASDVSLSTLAFGALIAAPGPQAPGPTGSRMWRDFARRGLPAVALLGPAVIFFTVLFAIPIALMIRYSVLQQTPDGAIVGGLTGANYARLASVDLYRHVLFATLRISLFTTLAAAVLAYPLALLIARGPALLGRLLTVLVIAPLLVNVVVRAYGWRVILANSNTGALNWALAKVGLGPVHLLYTEWAIIIGSVQVFLPMMVLPLSSTIGRIDRAVEEAARTLGASAFAVFRRVTLPLSIPGLGVGCTLVFSLTASSFILPSLLGGDFTKMLGTLVEEQILSVYDWPFGAAIATVMIAIVLAVNLSATALFERGVKTRATEPR